MTQIELNEAAIDYRFVHASGPGGQHVNKASTAVELRADLDRLGLPPGILRRLTQLARNRINRDRVLVIQADEHRSQLKNKKEALKRLEDLIEAASVIPKRRIATRPSAAARRRRVDRKKQRAQTKANRRPPKY